MPRPRANNTAILADLWALFADDAPHSRGEMMTVVRRHGGADARHWRRAIQKLKRRGFYVAHDRRRDLYVHRTDHIETMEATSKALVARGIPELANRILAHRGERLRAIHHRGESPQPYDDDIAMLESTLSSMALAAGLSPSATLLETMLTADQEAAILAETP